MPHITTLHDALQHIDALIQSQLAPNASQIAAEALNSTAVALPRHAVASVILAVANIGTIDTHRTAHAAAALELIRAGAAMHRRLIDPSLRTATQRTSTPSFVHGPTLMLGDYFYALAANEMAESPNARIIADYATCVMQIAEAFLTSIPLSDPAVFHNALLHIDAIEGALMQCAINAGMICGGITSFVDENNAVASELARVYATTIHIHEALSDPLRSLQRGIIILPLAHALQTQPDHTMHLINQADSVALSAFLQECGGISATVAIHQQAVHTLTQFVATVPASTGRDMFQHLINHSNPA
jgi:heptaprenyl diphosphate synthase/octaprenyl-diphosphate synthase